MAENRFRTCVSKRKGLAAGAAVTVVAALVLFLSTAGYVFPGESARLAALWSGLDPSAYALHPLTAFFARLFGAGNLLAPVCGTLAAMLVYALVSFFVRERFAADEPDEACEKAGRTAGLVAAGLFLVTPAVREAFTHLNLASFAFAWSVAALGFVLPFARARKGTAWLCPLVAGVMCGVGSVDSASVLLFVPVTFVAFWIVASRRGAKPFPYAVLFVFAFAVAALATVGRASAGVAEIWGAHRAALDQIVHGPNALFVILFATVPFFVNLLASGRSLNGEPAGSKWIFQMALTLVTVLAFATPLAPSALMRPSGVLPVFACAFVAVNAGVLAVYWWREFRREDPEFDPAVGTKAVNPSRIFGIVGGGVLALATGLTAVMDFFLFERDRGVFADRLADRLVADLDGREWVLTNGLLDDHIRFAARRAGKNVRLVCLHRDLDEKYLEGLAEVVRDEKLGGEANANLLLSLRLGVVPFVEDWFASDPDVARKAVVFGQPDLWLGGDRRPVPEGLFFGGDEKRVVGWEEVWQECRAWLEVPENWGSYRMRRASDPLERFRFALRRHLGFVGNNRGVWLWDLGREDEAFDQFERVLGEIDPDNVSALFNECELAAGGYPRAASKLKELAREVRKSVDDPDRRYELWVLSSYYGYIRNPDAFVRQGHYWARSGRPGEALQHVRRAGNLVSGENRALYLNLLASLYAADTNRGKSRELFEEVLKDAPEDHDALAGMMRLFLANGDTEKALEYLERAIASVGDDPRYENERVLACILKGDLAGARARLRRRTDEDRTDFQSWAMLSSVAMRQIEGTKDAKERADLMKELEKEIYPMLEKYAKDPSEYNVQTVKAFLLLHSPGDNRKAARDALVAAARSRPDVAATSDMILSLDMSLNDRDDAERAARDMLRRNRKSPFANYVMGSLALQRGETAEAEAYLRRAVLSDKPMPLALNDLAETLRRRKAYAEAIKFARSATEAAPDLYVAWETLGTTLMESEGDMAEAEACILKACDLSAKMGGDGDVRMFIALARVQLRRGEKLHAAGTLRKAASRANELTDYERKEFEELKKRAR